MVKNEFRPLIQDVINDLKVKLKVNLIAVYGIGSYFDDSLPVNFRKNDIDLIAIVKFTTRGIANKEVFVGYNTIQSYNNKELFEKSSGANYEWALICIKHPENSKLLYGTDIRDQIPETFDIQFDYDNILIRGFYHLEKSLENIQKDLEKAKEEYSKAMFKFGYFFCVFYDKSFRYVSLTKIREKLEKVFKPDTIERQTFNYFEMAFEYRKKGYYESNFNKLLFFTRYYFISLLRNGKTHRLMSFDEIKTFFSGYFGGLLSLKKFVKNIEADIKLKKNKKESFLS